MVKFLINQIKVGNISLLDVPPMWRASVEVEMGENSESRKENEWE